MLYSPWTFVTNAIYFPYIRTELKASAAVFKERDSNMDAYKKSRYALIRTIKHAERQYRTKNESYFIGSGTHQMWQGLKSISDYKGKPIHELRNHASLSDKLKAFYARFEARNTEHA